MVFQLDSRENPKVKHFIRLLNNGKYREEQGLFAIEGARLCMDALQSGIPIAELFYTEEAAKKYNTIVADLGQKALKTYQISEGIAKKMGDTTHPQGVFCTCKTLDKPDDLVTIGTDSRILAMENIQDPANLGAMLRTAEAVGIKGVICSAGCCDMYHPKVLRASMGAVFRLSVRLEENLPKMLRGLTGMGVLTMAAVPDASACPVTSLRFDRSAVAVIGNEGNGLTKEAIEACEVRVTIPMKGRAESLNASMAAGILMWEMLR
ncbi:RNA methyltransferase [[Clostridium] leptum]|uniref:23S rRNA methyltransferase n=1 Tax=Solibaculum mannosilyticum TaxID=2780922 RepID=A0A7I8D0D9_9FIRM|nr:RNA methyltransferase [Solibaculum mannosilyticum]MCO7136241.1 RNA methyltransferase [[Clostridium] leptum]BCI60240.1 23S rRNA methyltransferase [Solibaculum mannosilyticum]